MTGILGRLGRLLTRRKGAQAFPEVSRQPIDNIQLNVVMGLAAIIDLRWVIVKCIFVDKVYEAV